LCGQGVFARRRFRTGETIGEIQGEVIHDDTYWSAYCIDLGDGAVLEPAVLPTASAAPLKVTE
jgi:hypothetical protein